MSNKKLTPGTVSALPSVHENANNFKIKDIFNHDGNRLSALCQLIDVCQKCGQRRRIEGWIPLQYAEDCLRFTLILLCERCERERRLQ